MIGTLLSDRYRLESKLGSGGMSTVYLARDETLERRVAVKVLHREISDQPDQIERFRREARTVAQLSHPNVVSVIDAGEDGGHPFIIFEYVEGETLKQRIERIGKLPLDEATAYAIEVGRGLAAAHGRRLVHRDVKPQNVLIDSEGRAKVTDFGIARSLEAEGLTATGRVLGTTDYVSPEQAMGQAVDARTDVYSLGIVLYETLLGEVPFHAETQVGVAMKHVNEAMPDVQTRRAEVSSVLADAVDRATAKDPEERYPDMGTFLADLETALEVEVARAGHSTGEATTVLDSVPRRRRRILTRRRISWVGVLVLIAAGAAALAFAALSGDQGPSREEANGSEPVRIVEGADFDPEETGGDGEEHAEEVELAFDGDPSTTAWSTETYDGGLAGANKQGVGLVLDVGEPIEAQRIKLVSAEPGWSLDVYASESSSPPEDLEGWGEPIASVSGVDTEQTLGLQGAPPARHYLLWITELAQTDSGDRVEIADVRIFF